MVITPDLAGLGLALTSFLIENISLPPEVEQALDQRTKMGVLGDMSKYTQYRTAEAIGDEPGQASAVKMLRSLLVKGLEALLWECAVGAHRYGVDQGTMLPANCFSPCRRLQ